MVPSSVIGTPAMETHDQLIGYRERRSEWMEDGGGYSSVVNEYLHQFRSLGSQKQRSGGSRQQPN